MEYYDIVLFSPPSRMINHYRPPVGLLYLGGYLLHMGLRVKIIDVPLKEQIRNKEFFDNVENVIEDVYQEMLNEFRRIKTKLVGISCYTPEYFEVVRLAKAIKEADPLLKIVVGGVHPTLYPQDFFDEENGVDICVCGEGEVTLYELCKNILNNSNENLILGGIKGIVYRDDRLKKIMHTPPRPASDNLDDISFPAHSLIDMQY